MTLQSRFAAIGIVGALIVGALCQPVAAQVYRPNPKYLEWQNPQDWTLHVGVTIRAYDNSRTRPARGNLEMDTWTFKTAAVVFPVAPASGSHETRMTSVRGTLQFEDREMSSRHRLITEFPAGAQYAVWDVSAPDDLDIVIREMELEVTIPVRSWRTVYHDAAAESVPWPQGEFPAEAKSTFEPMSYVDHDPMYGPYDMSVIQGLLRRWSGGNDPKSIPPATLAKWLCGQVVELIQPVGEGFAFNRNGQLEGIALADPNAIAQRRRGTPFELATVLCAVYREAGLPARLVVAYDVDEERGDRDVPILKNSSENTLRAWVEFALFDESDGSLTWIPVDPYRIRKSMSRMPRGYLERAVKFFGTHDELDGVAPFTHHFFPPTTVRSYGGSGSPAFWGWFVTPKSPDRAIQAITFRADSTAKRAGDDPARD